MDQWYENLETNQKGEKVFGVNHYTQTPQTRPPTLTLNTAHPYVDLTRVKFPVNIEVGYGCAKYYREQHKDDEAMIAIDNFIRQHRLKGDMRSRN